MSDEFPVVVPAAMTRGEPRPYRLSETLPLSGGQFIRLDIDADLSGGDAAWLAEVLRLWRDFRQHLKIEPVE